MKLYVWEGFCYDYSPGLAVALANSVDEAKNQIGEVYDISKYTDWGELKVYEVTEPMAAAVGGGG